MPKTPGFERTPEKEKPVMVDLQVTVLWAVLSCSMGMTVRSCAWGGKVWRRGCLVRQQNLAQLAPIPHIRSSKTVSRISLWGENGKSQ